MCDCVWICNRCGWCSCYWKPHWAMVHYVMEDNRG
jgi:hypothetical protein